MRRPQFAIRNLLGVTAVIGGVMTFLTQPGQRWIALMITLLLANVLAVVVTLVVYVLLPILERRRPSAGHPPDND